MNVVCKPTVAASLKDNIEKLVKLSLKKERERECQISIFTRSPCGNSLTSCRLLVQSLPIPEHDLRNSKC